MKRKIFKKIIFQGLSSENGIRYSRCKAKNATFYYKMLHFFYFELTIIVLWILDILRGESLSFCMCRITFSTIKEYSMGTTQPIRNKDELTAFRMYYKDIRPNSRN